MAEAVAAAMAMALQNQQPGTVARQEAEIQRLHNEAGMLEEDNRQLTTRVVRANVVERIVNTGTIRPSTTCTATSTS